ncbi:MAG TPA: hypothetical protein VGG25_24700 [Streptosporangiaceae bacterium]|jgi:Tol biopolymer transport system component
MGGTGMTGRSIARRWAMTAAAGLTALGLLGTGLAGTAQAAYPGRDGRIAFVRDGNIYTISSGGSGLTRLTSGGHHKGPRWSPNGKRIAYLNRGNLWVMNAGGGHKRRLTDAAPTYTDARPSWSPNGRYLAFVRTRARHAYGYLVRYDTHTGHIVTFSTPYNSEQPTTRQIPVAALPDPIAWTWTPDGSTNGSFILFEGGQVGHFCQAGWYCLDAYGRPHQYMYRNGFLSAEDQTQSPVRLTDPDWFPDDPQFDIQAMTTQENCVASNPCTPSGIDLQITESPIVPGAYQAVFSPVGRQIAYVLNERGGPEIFIGNNDVRPLGRMLTAGTQPDWQPLT